MKMIKEIQEEPFQEQSLNKDSSKNVEPPKNDTSTENIVSKITSDLNSLSIRSEVSKSPEPKKEINLIDDNAITNKDKEEEEKIIKNKEEEVESDIKIKNQKKI